MICDDRKMTVYDNNVTMTMYDDIGQRRCVVTRDDV